MSSLLLTIRAWAPCSHHIGGMCVLGLSVSSEAGQGSVLPFSCVRLKLFCNKTRPTSQPGRSTGKVSCGAAAPPALPTKAISQSAALTVPAQDILERCLFPGEHVLFVFCKDSSDTVSVGKADSKLESCLRNSLPQPLNLVPSQELTSWEA